jgi:hypothetical protein
MKNHLRPVLFSFFWDGLSCCPGWDETACPSYQVAGITSMHYHVWLWAYFKVIFFQVGMAFASPGWQGHCLPKITISKIVSREFLDLWIVLIPVENWLNNCVCGYKLSVYFCPFHLDWLCIPALCCGAIISASFPSSVFQLGRQILLSLNAGITPGEAPLCSFGITMVPVFL